MGILLDSLKEYVSDQYDNEAAAKAGKTGFTGEVGASARDIYSDTLDAAGTLSGSDSLVDAARRSRKISARTRANSSLPQSWDDVHGAGDFVGYVEKGLASSVPTIATLAVGGIAGRAAAGGLRLAAGGARAAETIGALAPTELSSVGNKFDQQRDQTGTTDTASAFGYGTIDNALNLVGEGRIAIGGLSQSFAKSRLARAAIVAGKTGIEEGAAEVGQQFTQELSRRSVDESYDVLNPEAQKRYKESLIGGTLLGGVVGGVGGAAHRDPNTPAATPAGDSPTSSAPVAPTNDGAPKEILGLPAPSAITPGPADERVAVSGKPVDTGVKPNTRNIDVDFFTGVTPETLRPTEPGSILRAIQGDGKLNKYNTELATALHKTLSNRDIAGAAAHVENLTAELQANANLKPETIARRAASLNTASDIITAYALKHDAVSSDINAARTDNAAAAQKAQADALAAQAQVQAAPAAPQATDNPDQQARIQANHDIQVMRQAILQDTIANAVSGKNPRLTLMNKLRPAMKKLGGDPNPTADERLALEQAIDAHKLAKAKAKIGDILDLGKTSAEPDAQGSLPLGDTPATAPPSAATAQAAPEVTAAPIKPSALSPNYQGELLTARKKPTKSALGQSEGSKRYRAQEAAVRSSAAKVAKPAPTEWSFKTLPQQAIIRDLNATVAADPRFASSAIEEIKKAAGENKLPTARKHLEAEKARLFKLADTPAEAVPHQDVRDAIGAYVRDYPEQYKGSVQDAAIKHLDKNEPEKARALIDKDRARIVAEDAKGGISPETKKDLSPKPRKNYTKEQNARVEPKTKTKVDTKPSVNKTAAAELARRNAEDAAQVQKDKEGPVETPAGYSLPQRSMISELNHNVTYDENFAPSAVEAIAKAVADNKTPLARTLLEAEKERLAQIEGTDGPLSQKQKALLIQLQRRIDDSGITTFDPVVANEIRRYIRKGELQSARDSLLAQVMRIDKENIAAATAAEATQVQKAKEGLANQTPEAATKSETDPAASFVERPAPTHLPVERLLKHLDDAKSAGQITAEEALALDTQLHSGDALRVQDAHNFILDRAKDTVDPETRTARSHIENLGPPADPTVVQYEIGRAREEVTTEPQRLALDHFEKVLADDHPVTKQQASSIINNILSGDVAKARHLITVDETRAHDVHQLENAPQKYTNFSKFIGAKEALEKFMRYNRGTYDKTLPARMEALLGQGKYEEALAQIPADRERIQAERIALREKDRLKAQAAKKAETDPAASTEDRFDLNYRKDGFNPREPSNLRRLNDVKAQVYDIVRAWRNLPKIEVFDSRAPTNDAQVHALQELGKAGIPLRSELGVTRGAFFTYKGRAHVAIFSDNVTTPADILATVYHEVLGHYGLRDRYASDITRMLADMYTTTPEIRHEINARSGMTEGISSMEMLRMIRVDGEEILAELIESKGIIRPGIISKVSGIVRFYARKMGLLKTAWTADELTHVLRQGQRQVLATGVFSRPGFLSKHIDPSEARTAPRTVKPAQATPANTSTGEVNTRSKQFRDSLEKRGAPAWMVSAINTLDSKGRIVLQGMMSGNNLVTYAEKHGLPDYARYNALSENMQAVATEYTKRLDQIIIQATRLPKAQLTQLNAYLKDATIKGEWGFQPTWRTDTVEITPEANAAYDALPKAMQDVARNIFQYSHDSRTELQKVVHAYINGEADADTKNALNQSELDDVKNRRARQIKLFDASVPKLLGPYAPLMRFGDYVASAKSQAMLDLEALGKERTKEQAAQLEAMRVDPNHYTVLFRDTQGQADQEQAYLGKTGLYGEVYSAPRSDFYNQIGESPLMQMQKLKDLVTKQLGGVDNLDRPTTRKIEALLKDLYISTLADNSARKHDLRRRGISGADDNMIRAVASKGRADAHFLAQMKNRHELNSVLQTLTDKANVKDEKLQERKSLLNEIIMRHTASMERDETPWQDKAMAISTAWHLSTSPRYYIQNLMQPAMVSIPLLAGRHGYTRAWGALMDGYKVLAPHVRTADFWAGKVDLQALGLGADETAMLKYAQDHGKLDVGMAYDAGHWDATNSGSKYAAEITHFFRTKSGQVEVINRVSSGLAAYRLAIQDGSTHEKARDAAMLILDDTQFNYSKVNAPRYLSNFPLSKVVTQFRKYQIYQISLLAKLLSTSTMGSNAEEKYIARKALGYMFAQLGIVSGAVGLPGAQLAGVLGSALFGDKDEPLDGERWLEKTFGDGDMAKVLLRGVPTGAGIEMSGVGLGPVLNPFPFMDYTQLGTESGLEKAVLTATGPIGGVAQKFVRAAQAMDQGDYMRAATSSLPSGMGYVLKAYAESQTGLTKRNGDQLLSPDEISFANEVLQGLGFAPTQVLSAQRLTAQTYEFDQYFKDRTAEIKFAYTQAVKSGDGETAQEAKTSWDALQTGKRRAGFKVAPLGDLLRAPAEQRKREHNTAHGVQFRDNNKGFVEGAVSR